MQMNLNLITTWTLYLACYYFYSAFSFDYLLLVADFKSITLE